MSPWEVLGWMLVGILALAVGLVVLSVLLAVARSAGTIGEAFKEKRRAGLAKRGKLLCDAPRCLEVATRSCPNQRYCCERHISLMSRSGRVSWASPLAHFQDEFDAKFNTTRKGDAGE